MKHYEIELYMSNQRITRQQAQSDPYLKNEIEAFDPFTPSKSIPRDEDFPSTPIRNLPGTSTPHESRSSSEDLNETIKFVSDKSNSKKPDNIQKNYSTRNQSNSSKMSESGLNSNQTVSLKDALQVVPEYNGSNIPLSQFLEGCSEAKEMLDPEAESNLTKLIRSKIFGEARQAILGKSFIDIEQLKDYLKEIYAPAKTVNQLLGELGQEFQRENESVIAFANRIREIGSRILEAHKIANGNVNQSFKTSTENNIIECFKRGLLPEIEQRLGEEADISNIIKEAIKIERQLEAQKALRNMSRLGQESRIPRRREVYACQICHEEGHEASRCQEKLKIVCRYCKKAGHSLEQCYVRPKVTQANVTCQICNRTGHTALKCYSRTNCQICHKSGHSADTCFQRNGQNNLNNPDLRFEARARLSCQVCHKIGHTAATCRIQQQSQSTSGQITIPLCHYCKNRGHTIAECRKRQYNSNRNEGNEKSLQVTSANKETLTTQTRSQNRTEIDDLLCELLP